MEDLLKINQQLLTVEEAATILKVSKYTIKRWLKSGKLQGSKLGSNRWKVLAESCNQLFYKGSNI